MKTKKGGEAWTLSQSSKDPAKVNAAKQAVNSRLSKPVPKKTNARKTPQVSFQFYFVLQTPHLFSSFC